MNFADLLASSDALLCKPGYGSFVEAASCGVPVLYVARPDWPESLSTGRVAATARRMPQSGQGCARTKAILPVNWRLCGICREGE